MAENWQIVILRYAKKTLAKLPRNQRERIERAIDHLAADPRPSGYKRLTGYDLYRIRVGDWRVIYAIEDDRLIILIVDVSPRDEAYRDL